MDLPPRKLAHLYAHFPAWLQLARQLIERGGQDDRFTILPSNLDAARLLELLAMSTLLHADLVETCHVRDQRLQVVYQTDVREADRYLLLASGRFMLEVLLDKAEQPIALVLLIFNSERDGMPYPLLPWGRMVERVTDYLWTGNRVITVEELE